MSPSAKGCEAHQVGDQMFCDRCGLVWDTNDPDTPMCIEEVPVTKQDGIKIFEKILEDLKHEEANHR